MSFKDPRRIWSTVQKLVEVSAPRARNRARIVSVFNGDPPYTDSEAEDNSVGTNVNFLEGTELIHKARSQFNNAFLAPGRFFTVSLDVGPPWKRREWSQIITTTINRIMKRSPRFYQSLQDQFAGVVLHGIGPITWFRDRDWCPKAHGVEDLLVPSNTLRSFENMDYFALYTTFTASQLVKATLGKAVDKGWNMELVKAALNWLAENSGKETSNQAPMAADYPEKMEEDFKENAGYWNSDATPIIRCYDFYFLDNENDSPVWRRKIILDKQSVQLPGEKMADDIVIYDGGKKNYGEELNKILQCQFADGSVKPPFRYHSVRSLGYLLYAVSHLQNRIRCKFNDAVFESMLWYFRNVTTGDEEKLQKIDLHHLGIIPDGLSWVPGNERHTVDPNLIGMAMAQNRQLMAEKSSSYVQDVEKNSTSREETATEIMAKVNASNAMIGSMLSEAYTYENYKHQEIARRFTIIDHPDCVEFRQLCMAQGVPPQVFAALKAWNVMTERSMGNGNKTMQVAQSDRLMQIKDVAEIAPDKRRDIVRSAIATYTDDPVWANDIIPPSEDIPTSAQQVATLAWGTLIDGKPVIIASAINPVDYIQTLLKLLDSELAMIEQNGGNPDIRRVMGLANVVQHIEQHIQQIALDKAMAPVVRQAMDMLKEAGNLIKAYMQRLQEQAAQQGQQMDPADVAKIQALMVTAQSKATIAEENAAQKRRHKEMAFVQDQNRRDASTKAELARKAASTGADIEAGRVLTAAEIEKKDHEARAGIIRDNVIAATKPQPKPEKKAKKK